MLVGNIIFIKGNHDSFKALNSGELKMYGLNIFMTHKPPKCMSDILPNTNLILCGHIHEKWKTKKSFDGIHNIPIINVGVDQWNFSPVRLSTLIKLYYKLIK